MTISETTESSAPTGGPKARKAKEQKVNLKRLPTAAHAAAAQGLIDKSQRERAVKRKRASRGEPRLATAEEGEIYFTEYSLCGAIAPRKYYSDAMQNFCKHTALRPEHRCVLKTRKPEKPAKQGAPM